MDKSFDEIEKVTNGLLSNLKNKEPPVNLDEIIKKQNIVLIEKEFSDERISGAAVVEGDLRIITVNRQDSPQRKRFTKAHELGHLLLHGIQDIQITLPTMQFYRNHESSTGEIQKEREANYFASCLLMPKLMVEEALVEISPDRNLSDITIERLANKFKVSVQAMTFRLARLGFS